ncbi:hypothetical protein [Streptomyces sp. NPDC055186]
MLMRTDPFRELDRLTQQVFGAAARPAAMPMIAERPTGSSSRRLFLGGTPDTERVDASCAAGVPRLRVPVAEQAEPREIAVGGGDSRKQISG